MDNLPREFMARPSQEAMTFMSITGVSESTTIQKLEEHGMTLLMHISAKGVETCQCICVFPPLFSLFFPSFPKHFPIFSPVKKVVFVLGVGGIKESICFLLNMCVIVLPCFSFISPEPMKHPLLLLKMMLWILMSQLMLDLIGSPYHFYLPIEI